MTLIRAFCWVVAVPVLAVAPHLLSAQEPVADSLAVVPLDPLTVSVLRTRLRSDLVPYAVDALRRGEVDRARPALGVDEALRGVAGVQVDNRHNYALGERISVRGFGARSQFGVRGIKVVVDGIPATLPDGQTTLNHVDLGVLGRVELVRGPASAQWGNAAGGVILFESAPPAPVRLRQELDVVGGANGLMRLSSTTGGRSGGASYRIGVSRMTTDGYRAWSRADNLHATALVAYRTGVDELRLTGNFVHYDAQNPGSLSAALLAEDRTQAYAFNRIQRTGEKATQTQLGATWRRNLPAAELELGVYGVVKDLSNPIPPSIIDIGREVGGVRAALHARSAIAGRELRWSVGTEAELQRDDRQNRVNEGGEPGALTLDQRETVTSEAIFVQLAAPITTRLHALGGLRYDRFAFDARDRLVGAGNPDDSGRRDMDALSPSLGVLYELVSGVSVYANTAPSFETPTTTELVNRPSGAGGFNPELEPQRTRSLEAGVKGRLGDVALCELSVYRARVEHALIPFEVPEAEGRQFFRNAGSARHRGVEVNLSFADLAGFAGRVAYTYTDARFERYATADSAYDGNRVPGVAPFRFDAALSYRSERGWFVGLDHRRLSRIPADDANSAYSPRYRVTDMRAGFTDARVASVDVSPYAGVTNLFDVAYNTAVTVNAFGGRYFEPGPGRAAYLGARITFGSR